MKKLLWISVALGLAACGQAAPKIQPLINTPIAAPSVGVPATQAGTPSVLMTQPAAAPTVTLPPPAIPTAVLSPSPTAVPETDLLFTGDINPARCVYAAAKAANDMALPYRPLASLLQGAGVAIGSLDGAISDYNPPTPCIETTRQPSDNSGARCSSTTPCLSGKFPMSTFPFA